MILIAKCEGNNPLAGRTQKGNLPLRPSARPAPSGSLEIDRNVTRETTLTFAEAYSIEHSSSGASATSIGISANSFGAAAPTGYSNPLERSASRLHFQQPIAL